MITNLALLGLSDSLILQLRTRAAVDYQLYEIQYKILNIKTHSVTIQTNPPAGCIFTTKELITMTKSLFSTIIFDKAIHVHIKHGTKFKWKYSEDTINRHKKFTN